MQRPFLCLGMTLLLLSCSEQPKATFPNGVDAIQTGYTDAHQISAAYCRGCHKVAHENWSKGMHAQAFENSLFREAFALETRQWCVNCHAPLKEQAAKVNLADYRGKSIYDAIWDKEPLLKEGINCAACHVRNGTILGSYSKKAKEHEIVRSDFLKTSEFCAQCHQFNFPEFHTEAIVYTSEPMQSTHQESKEFGVKRQCQFCHYEDHLLRGPHTKDWLRSAVLNFDAKIAGDKVEIALRLMRRGHIVPTGDLFHALALEIASDATFANVLFEKKWARTFAFARQESGLLQKKLKENNGMRPDEDWIYLRSDLPQAGPVFVRLVYYYHDNDLGGKSALPEAERLLVLREARLR